MHITRTVMPEQLLFNWHVYTLWDKTLHFYFFQFCFQFLFVIVFLLFYNKNEMENIYVEHIYGICIMSMNSTSLLTDNKQHDIQYLQSVVLYSCAVIVCLCIRSMKNLPY